MHDLRGHESVRPAYLQTLWMVRALPAIGLSMGTSSPNVLLIVSRHNSTLYSYACSEFEGLGKDIDVVLDRRRGERRRRSRSRPPTADERRRADRRAYAIDDDLRGIGWAFVRRDMRPTLGRGRDRRAQLAADR
jgi:hypothetical protein